METPSTEEKAIIVRYGISLFLTLTALLLTSSVSSLKAHHSFYFFQTAVFTAAWFGGVGPALLSSAISILSIDYFLLPPTHTLSIGVADIPRLVVFGVVAILTGLLSARLRRTQDQLQRAHDLLERRVSERTEQLSQANHLFEEEIEQRRTAEREILQISSREQRRLSEDLHDGICQTLAGVRLLSQELIGKLSTPPQSGFVEATRIEKLLGEALAQADDVSQGLYPVELEPDGLVDALKELAKKISTTHRIRCRFISGVPVLIADSATATHLYRIAQEALTNSLKHGKATQIHLRLTKNIQRVMLSITDNGCGIREHSNRKGMGLKMMTYRAHVINGSFHIRSRRGGVTRVTCVLRSDSKEEVNSDGHQTSEVAS